MVSLFVPGFDSYFLNLRPPLLLSDCQDPRRSRFINCRNPWFRQFWTHHFSCRFMDQKPEELPQGKELEVCTGREALAKYEQEGLVPFVGKLYQVDRA